MDEIEIVMKEMAQRFRDFDFHLEVESIMIDNGDGSVPGRYNCEFRFQLNRAYSYIIKGHTSVD